MRLLAKIRWMLTGLVAVATLGATNANAILLVNGFNAQAAPGSVASGGSFDATLNGFGLSGLFAVDLLIDYDPLKLALRTGLDNGGFALGALTSQFIMGPPGSPGGPGHASITLSISPLDQVFGSGSLLVVHFSVLPGVQNGTTPIKFQSSLDPLYDGYLVPVSTAILQVGAVPEPSQWLAMLIGLSMVGTMVFRRRQTV